MNMLQQLRNSKWQIKYDAKIEKNIYIYYLNFLGKLY